jgi:hypothetical protein
VFAHLTNNTSAPFSVIDAKGRRVTLGVNKKTERPVELKDSTARALYAGMSKPRSIKIEEVEGVVAEENDGDPFEQKQRAAATTVTAITPGMVLEMNASEEGLKPADLLRLAKEAMPNHEFSTVRPKRQEIIKALEAAAAATSTDGDTGTDGDDTTTTTDED